MSVVIAWWFGVYCLLSMCHVCLEVRIKFLASDCLLPYFCRLPYSLIEATTELNKLLVHIMIIVMKILHLKIQKYSYIVTYSVDT